MHCVRDLNLPERTEPAEALTARLGRYVLVQRPAGALYHEIAKLLGRGETLGMAHEHRLGDDILGMLQVFESLLVLPLSQLPERGELFAGRAPDSDVVVQEPSVSTRHAVLRFDPVKDVCTVRDLDSRNGTFVNAKRIFARETVLMDGDAISFGDAPFLFLRTDSLREQLASLRLRTG